MLSSLSTKKYVLNLTHINNVFNLSDSGPIQVLPMKDQHLKPLFISSSSLFFQCSNISDMDIAKPGEECCIIIHYLRPSKPMDHHNAAY